LKKAGIEDPHKIKYETNRAEYERLEADSNYTNVAFDKKSGGVKATHKSHNFDKKKGSYEKNVQKVAFTNGNSIIFESEIGKEIGERYTEGLWNGKLFEIAGTETGSSNNLLKGLKHCASKRDTEIAVLYFPNNNFSEDILNNAIVRYKGLEKLQDGQFLKFQKIIVVSNNKIYEYGI
jgi:hypothetical protein